MTKPGTSRRRRQGTKYYAIQKEEFIGWGGGARRVGGRVKVAICRILGATPQHVQNLTPIRNFSVLFYPNANVSQDPPLTYQKTKKN